MNIMLTKTRKFREPKHFHTVERKGGAPKRRRKKSLRNATEIKTPWDHQDLIDNPFFFSFFFHCQKGNFKTCQENLSGAL